MARDADNRPGQPDIGLVSLPVLCCLLGAALFVYEYGGHEPTLTHEFAELEQAVATSRVTAETLTAQTRATAAQLALVEDSLAYLREQRALAALVDREQTLSAQRDLLDALARQAPDLAALKREAERLQAAQADRLAAAHTLFGGYNGHYVLLECVADAVRVFPGNRRIPLADFPAALPALLQEISACGYVAIAARADGWRERSFEPVRQQLYRALDALPVPAGTVAVRRTDFPLRTDEPIEPYLPNAR